MPRAMGSTHGYATVVIGIVVALLASAADSIAQPLNQGFVSVSAGLQAPSTDFTENFTFESNAEGADVAAVYGVDSSFTFDVSGGIFVWQDLAVGVGVSRFSKDAQATVSARLPNPFFFNQDRLVDGSAQASRTETAVHVMAQWGHSGHPACRGRDLRRTELLQRRPGLRPQRRVR